MERAKRVLRTNKRLIPHTRSPDEESHFDCVVSACCHRVIIRYWGFFCDLTDDLKNSLKDEGERRARECIADDCSSGELHYVHSDDDGEHLIDGWWEIEN